MIDVEWWMLGSFRIPKQCAAFGGEAVFLQAAVGFFGDGAFEDAFGKEPRYLFFELPRYGLVADGSCDFDFSHGCFDQCPDDQHRHI